MANNEYKKPTGTQDIYGKKQRYFERIREVAKEVSYEYNFEEIQTPIIEEEDLFIRSVGDNTDIVQKEMYTFKTKGDDKLALRPEGTASIARSYIENDFYKKSQPVKFFYFGPFFRYERPQKGRYRQFHQFGLEVLGKDSPALDSQLIKVFYNIFERLGLDVVVKVNSIGDDNCRPEYIKTLKKALKKDKDDLCDNCQRRYDENPLRILDCKNEKCQEITENAPQIVDHLCKACKKKFKAVLEYLDGMDIPYELDPFLVRGLDYYTNTVFEFFEKDGDLALGGGGRYDKLIELMGGRETPALGGAMGVERIAELMEEEGVELEDKSKKVFLAQLGNSAKKRAFELFEEFREEEIPVYESMGRDSLKSQMSRADKLGAKYTLILGRQECIKNQIIIREMKTGKQETVPLDGVVKEIKKRIK
ncbi:MAG: histidine--tRNA ligase [Patescibacteria group bacterium]